MIPICRLGVLLVLPCLTHTAGGGDQKHKWYMERYHWIIEQYESGDFGPAERRLWQEWEGTDNALVAVLNKTDSDQTRHLVTRRLMEMRSEKAVWPLIKQIAFEGPGILDLQVPLSGYPAALALVKIGQPALGAILGDRLRLPATDEELKLFAGVVYGNYILDSAVGRFHVERVLEKAQKQLEAEKDPDRSFVTWQQNLTRLLEFYDRIERGELFPGFSVP